MSAEKLRFCAKMELPPGAGLTAQIPNHPIFKNKKPRITSVLVCGLELADPASLRLRGKLLLTAIVCFQYSLNPFTKSHSIKDKN
jgi:hypothetical protein